MPALPPIYSDLADWFHLLTHPDDYADEAAFYRSLMERSLGELPGTLLELGSGGGNNASHMKGWTRPTLSDLSPAMLAQSRRINPELEHIEGDMRTLRLGRKFDAVFLHDAVCYMTDELDLRRALQTAFVHCRPGGVALVIPDDVKETFEPGCNHGGHDGSDGRALRYLEWHWDPDPDDSQVVTDIALLLRDADGTSRCLHERHRCGLFPRATWLALMRDVGFDAKPVESEMRHAPFLARRPVGP